MRIDVRPTRWRLFWDRIERTINRSPQKDDQLRAIAEDMRSVAQATYDSQEIGTGTGEAGNSFEVRQFDGGWVMSLSDRKSAWIESGAKAGGKTPVLNYGPIRAAMDHAEARGSRVSAGRGFTSPRTVRI